MSERKVLGRGLSSLIPPAAPSAPRATAEPARIVPVGATAGELAGRALSIPVAEIFVNPRQPRRRFSEAALDELAQSIREVGILQPLLVRKTERGYELIAGERRLRAAKKAGLHVVPAVVRASSDVDQLDLALIENLQREDLNPIEEAQGFQRLQTEFGFTQDDVARKVGKERSTVANLLRLLNLSPAVQEMLATGALAMGHARALLPLEDPRRQETIARRVEKEGLSVRQVESLVRSMLKAPAGRRRAADQADGDPNLRHLADELQRVLGTRVELLAKGKGGEVRIHFYTPEDLRRVTDRLLR
jgi:ParB family chromosome partitioning protein